MYTCFYFILLYCISAAAKMSSDHADRVKFNSHISFMYPYKVKAHTVKVSPTFIYSREAFSHPVTAAAKLDPHSTVCGDQRFWNLITAKTTCACTHRSEKKETFTF